MHYCYRLRQVGFVWQRIERNLLLAAMGISGLIAVLLLVVLQQSLRIERRREEGVERLRDSHARYHALVEATSEGTLLVVDGQHLPLVGGVEGWDAIFGVVVGPEEFGALEAVHVFGFGDEAVVQLWSLLFESALRRRPCSV